MYEARRFRTAAHGLTRPPGSTRRGSCSNEQSRSAKPCAGRMTCSSACCSTISSLVLSKSATSRGLSLSNVARSPSSTSHGARATRIRRWHGYGWRCCCSRPVSGSKRGLIASATQLIEKTLGAAHSWFATCLRAQASLRYNARDLDAAEESYRRAMTILEKVGDDESPAYTAVLNNLGLIYADKRDLARAEEHYRRALALAEMLEGPESYHISLYLQNLGTSRATARSTRRRSSTRRAHWPFVNGSSAPNTSTSPHS